MIEKVIAVAIGVYGVCYSSYFLTNLTRHLMNVISGAGPKSTKPASLSAPATSAPREEYEEDQIEQYDREAPSGVSAERESSEPMTEATTVSALAPSPPGKAEEEEIEEYDREAPSVVTPEPESSEPMTETPAVSALAPSPPGEEAREEQIEEYDREAPSVVTPEPESSKAMTEATTVSALAPSAPGEEAREEEIEEYDREAPLVVTPEPESPEPMIETTAVSALAPSPPGEEAREEQIEEYDREAPSVVTPEPESPEPMTEETTVSALAPSAPEEEAREEQIEKNDREAPSVVTLEPESSETMTETPAVSALAPSPPGEQAKEEQIEEYDLEAQSGVIPEPESPEPMTEATTVSALAPSASGEEAKEEQIEEYDHEAPSVVTPEPESAEPMIETTAVSALAPSPLGEEAKREQVEQYDLEAPSVVTAQPEFLEPVLPEKEQEQPALSEMPWQTREELFPAQEQEEQLRQQVKEPQENGQNIKAESQAELPGAQSAIMEVKKGNKEDMRGIQEEMNLRQQRGDQQDQVSERVAATPLMKDPLSCILQNLKEQLDTELQKIDTKMKAKEKRQEEEMKIIREKLSRLPQALEEQVQTLTSRRAACKDFQQMSGNEEPQAWHEIHKGFVKPAAAAALSKGAFAPQRGKWSQGSLPISSAAQHQEIKDDSLEQLRKIVNMENPVGKYSELEYIGSGTFGFVVRAINKATGVEVAIKKINLQGPRKKELKAYELMTVKINKNPNVVNYLGSYLVDNQFWLVMEFMDGGTLSDVISKTYLSEDEIAAISREVSKPTCASEGLGRIVWETEAQNRRGFMYKLCFPSAGMLWASKSISRELPASAPALSVLSSCTLISCCCSLTLPPVFVFALLHLASLNLYLEPVCTAFLACKSKGAGGRI
uniref:non-specific serine/threonine protein kinase n=1 Tax=Taeniopygia guttata TaxID=59729 RepID=A0A674GAN8_TAEGU